MTVKKSEFEILVKQIISKKPHKKCKNEKQKEYCKLISDNEITFCQGPAGSGKSWLSLLMAIHLLVDNPNKYQKIYIVRSPIEMEDKLGSIPGTLLDKLYPYMKPTFKLGEKMLGTETFKKLLQSEIIEPISISHIRGDNIDNAILIGEEAQNFSKKQMKTLLTRIGFNAKFIISGDIDQSDKFTKAQDTGLYYCLEHLNDIPNIGVMYFELEDVVRNPIITEILKKF